MTDAIEAFLNSEAGKKAREYLWTSMPAGSSRDDALKSARAFLSSLAESGAMREARGWDHSGSDYWSATTSGASMLPNDFVAFILRRE